jgi:hypothetical protein
MRARWSFAIVLALLTCKAAHPDTITTKDNLSINGSLVGMSNGILTLKARFLSKEKEVWIPVEDVRSIEFNSLTSNPGPPPKILGIGPPADQTTPQKEPSIGDVIVFRGGERKPCILVRIDADRVHCDPNDTAYNRITALRIIFGSK